MEGRAEFASPYFEDEDPTQIVIISLSKKGGCRFRLMQIKPQQQRKGLKMSVYLIAFLAVTIPFMAGYYLGVSDGKVEGRIEQFQAKR